MLHWGSVCAIIFSMTDKYELVWAAGILEGEGSFLLRANRTPVVACQMTDEDVIYRLQRIIGGNIYFVSRQKDHHKDSWKLLVCGKEAYTLMSTLKEHMGKRRQEQIQAVFDGYELWLLRVDNDRQIRENVIAVAVNDYRNGGGSFKEVAARHGIADKTLQKYNKIIA